MSTTRKILLILGFLSTLAAIALIAVAVTQNQPLPKNVKVLQAEALIEKQAKQRFRHAWCSRTCCPCWVSLISLSGSVHLKQSDQNRYAFTRDHLLSNHLQSCYCSHPLKWKLRTKHCMGRVMTWHVPTVARFAVHFCPCSCICSIQLSGSGVMTGSVLSTVWDCARCGVVPHKPVCVWVASREGEWHWSGAAGGGV